MFFKRGGRQIIKEDNKIHGDLIRELLEKKVKRYKISQWTYPAGLFQNSAGGGHIIQFILTT